MRVSTNLLSVISLLLALQKKALHVDQSAGEPNAELNRGQSALFLDAELCAEHSVGISQCTTHDLCWQLRSSSQALHVWWR